MYERAFRGDLTPEGALLEAALVLALLAKRSGARLDVDAARMLDAVWLARKRKDRPTLARWGRGVLQYLGTRKETERWGTPLPPQAGLDRSAAMSELVTEAQRIGAANLPPVFVAELLMGNVQSIFPNLCPNPLEIGKSKAMKAKIARRYETLRNEAQPTGRAIDSDKLVSAALCTFGVKAGDVWNWLKGIPIAVATASAATAPPVAAGGASPKR
jgi:hypothetical protein